MKLSMLRDISRRFAPPETPEEMQKIWEVLHAEGIDFQNFYQELEMSDPYVETHRDESHTNAVMSLHSHDFYEMLYCQISGDVEYLVGAKRYRIQTGDIIIVAPGISHRPLLEDQNAVYKRDVVWFSPSFVEKISQMLPGSLLSHSSEDMIFLRTANTKWEFLGDMFRSGVKEAEREKPGYQGIVLGNTITILTQIARALEEGSAKQQKAEKPELLERVMAYIEKNLSQKITLEETAHHFYVSVSTITQLFRQKMGTSFYRCVTQRRLIAAKTLIGEGKSLEDVSRTVGFTDYSSFYRAFKKEYGITPRQYTQL